MWERILSTLRDWNDGPGNRFNGVETEEVRIMEWCQDGVIDINI